MTELERESCPSVKGELRGRPAEFGPQDALRRVQYPELEAGGRRS